MANELRHSDVGTALSKSEWEAVGGHIFNSQAAGDIMYASTTSQLSRLGIGSANQILAVNSGATAPEWVSGVNLATNFTVSANNSANETVYPVFVDGATGTQGAETDTGLTYNPSSGLLTATGFSGNLTGTLQTAAQANVTSLGTLTTLTVDNVIINGTTIGHTSDTDLMTLTDGVLTVAGEIDGTTLDISGNADIDGTLEADAYTVDGTALNEYIADTVGAMVGSNTETRIAVTYDDADNTLDFVVDDMTASGSTTFVLEDDDGTEVTVSNSKEVKFIGSGITTNWTDVDNGTDADPYDLTFTVDAAQTGITSVLNASLVVGRDADNDIDFSTDNNIRFRAGAEDQLTLTDGYLTPSSNAIVDLGTDALEFNNAFFDGTVEADAITIGGTNIVTGSLITTLGTISSGTWEGTTIAVDQGGTGATSLTDGGILLGSGTSAVTAMSVLANGAIVVGDGTTDPVALAAFTGSTGTLKHERGGIEADISAIAKGGIVAGSGTGSMAIRTVGSNDQVLTADSSEATGVKWADASGGGTIQLTNQGAIPAGAPVSVDSNGRATVISGLGNDLAHLGLSHDLTAGTTDNPSGYPDEGTHYSSYGTSLVDAGSTGVIMVRIDSGYNRIRVMVGTYSQTAGTTAGTREIQWGVEQTVSSISANVLSACWNTADDLLCILYRNTGASNVPQMIQYPISNKALGTASSTITLESIPCDSQVMELEWDENDNRYIALYSNSDSSHYELMCGVYQNDGGNPAQVIAPSQVSGDVTSRYATMKWANGGTGKDDCGLIVYHDQGDSQYVKAVGVTHNNSDTITYTGTPVEIFGADKAYSLGDKPRDSGNISFDTTAPPAAGGFATTDDVFVVAAAGTDADGDHIPYVVPVSVDSSDVSLVAGTVENPYVDFPDDWRTIRSGQESFTDIAATTPMSSKEGHHLAICYDPDRDVHVLVFRLVNYYGNPDADGGQHQSGSWIVSQTLTLNASNNAIIDNTYNTQYHPVSGNRQNLGVQSAIYTTNMGWFKPFYYGIGLHYHTTYDTMFVQGDTTIPHDLDTEYEFVRHLIMAFNGQTSANGGSAALTYAPSSVDRIIGFNTTAISDTGTGATATISLPGSENTNQSGLTTGKKYFIADSGTLTGYRSLVSRNFLIGGIATSASTKIMPKLNTSGIQI